MQLLTSYKLGNIELKNRMVMAPMTRSRSFSKGLATDLMAEYYAQRASAGLILSEAINISADAIGSPFTPGLYTAEQVESWKKVTDAVHKKGGVIFAQLWHTGRVAHSVDRNGVLPVAPSAVKIEGMQHFTSQGVKDYETPREMSIADIRQTIADYAQAAKNAIAAGFDGVELHAANGYLPQQFLSDSANLRTDEYGGSIENKARFTLEVMHALIDAVGGDKVGIKISPLHPYAGIAFDDPTETYTYLINELNKLDKEYEILKVKTDSNKSRYAEIKADFEKLVNEKKEVEEFQQKKTVMKEKLIKEIQEKKEEIDKKYKENKEKAQLIKSLEKEIKNLEVSEKELIKGVKDIEIKKRDQENEYGKLIEKISENAKKLESYNYELEEIPEERAKNNEEYKEIENETELQAIKRKLSVNEKSRMEIGSVNLSAIEEYERENTRYTELVNQKRDLLASREALLTLIGDIENDIVKKFNIALEEINKNFRYMCETILNGAKGAIRLLDEENLLETGLELSVKYKNKPEQTLMLLSGGEKSMLAVSFIMAIFMFKPSPFTFFDEIEAALDEENTKKIVKLLNKFITKSQFILITHNKETMKGSHRLYGITMNKEIGESRIISVDV